MNAADYFSNGVDLGMAVGDLVYVFDTATPLGSVHFVVSDDGTASTTGFAAIA